MCGMVEVTGASGFDEFCRLFLDLGPDGVETSIEQRHGVAAIWPKLLPFANDLVNAVEDGCVAHWGSGPDASCSGGRAV